MGIVEDMNSVLAASTRRESIHGGSTSASLLPTVVATSTEFMFERLW
jgi:hypothetical protein